MTRRVFVLLCSAGLVFVLSGAVFAAGGKAAKAVAAKPAAFALPPGAVELDTSAPKAGQKKGASWDSGIFSMALDGETLWVGRKGGVRKYDAKTGQWKYFPAAGCYGVGAGATAMAATGGELWALFGEDGWPCVLDTASGKWHKPADWTIKEHIRGGTIMRATGGQIVLNGAGGPDWEGVSIVDAAGEKWIKLLKTKPVKALWADGGSIWAGVSEGIVRIDRANDDYTYYLPSDYGCGSAVTSIAGTAAGIFAGTKPGPGYELGLRTKVFKDGIAVFSRREGQKYSYKWSYYKRTDRQRLTDDVTTASVPPREVKTPGGLCYWNGKAWRGIFKKGGLPDNYVTALATDGSYLYAGTAGGVAALDLKTLKVVKTIPQAVSPLAMAAGESGLWVADGKQIYRIPRAIFAGNTSETERKTKGK